jgi:hypothetical protein
VYLDVITQFPKLFKEVQDQVKEPLEKRRENRRAFFEREGDVQRAVKLMRTRRLIELPRRQDVRAFHDALANLKQRSYLQKRELAVLRAYAESVWEYLTWTGPVQKAGILVRGLHRRVSGSRQPGAISFCATGNTLNRRDQAACDLGESRVLRCGAPRSSGGLAALPHGISHT